MPDTEKYLVVGAGKFGQGVARALAKRGCHVIALDRDDRKLLALAKTVSKTALLDATESDALAGAAAGVSVAIVSLGDDVQASVRVVTTLKEAGVPTVVAKALADAHAEQLTRAGADRIVHPERDMGLKLATVLASPTVFDYVEVGPGYSILEAVAPRSFWGKSLADSDIRATYGVTVVAIKSPRGQERTTLVAPPADTVIDEGDILVVIGTESDVEKFGNLQ
jgi:trk system potassium uptake protein TrkA